MGVTYIGFCGPAGAGKTTFSKAVLELSEEGIHVHIIPMAQPLKRLAQEFFGWDGDKDEKGRALLQILGTECGRMYGGEDFWLDKWQGYVMGLASNPKYDNFIILCDDVRFDNEAQLIKDLGGKIIHITGKHEYYKQSWFDKLLISLRLKKIHATERGISKELVDEFCENDYNTVEEVKAYIKGKQWLQS